MLFLLLALISPPSSMLVARGSRPANRPKTRVIGPDDDPDFLWRLNHGDNNKPR